MSQKKLGPTHLIQGLGWAGLAGQAHFDGSTCKHVWKSMAPTIVMCFAWLVTREARLTCEILQKRDCQLCPDACYVVRLERNNYMFLHCKVISQLWTRFLSLTETKWSMLELTTDLLSCWNTKKWWRIIPHCIWLTMRRERNGSSFEFGFNNIQKNKGSCIAVFYFWCKEHCIENAKQLLDFLGLL